MPSPRTRQEELVAMRGELKQGLEVAKKQQVRAAGSGGRVCGYEMGMG
jgi:hypothetical protein